MISKINLKKACFAGLTASLVFTCGCKANLSEDKSTDKEEPVVEEKVKVDSSLSKEQLQEIEEDFSHMEYNYFLGIQFDKEDEINWDAVYENRMTKEYKPVKYKCLSGNKIGDTYSVLLQPVFDDEDRDKEILSPNRYVVFTRKGKSYSFRSNNFQWEDDCSETFNLHLEPYGDCKLVAFYGDDNQDTHLFITADKKNVASVDRYILRDEEQLQISDITDVAVMDYNKDSISDIIMTCRAGDEDHAVVCEGVISSNNYDYYMIEDELSAAVEESLAGDYSTEGIKEFLLFHKDNLEDYKSYKEAYIDLVDKIEADNIGKSKYWYDLKKLDGDRTPELIVKINHKQYVYTYKDKQLQNFLASDDDELDVELESGACCNYGQILNKLGAKKDKITKLYGIQDPSQDRGDTIEFTIGETTYSLKYNNHGMGHANYSFTDGIYTVSERDSMPINRVYLIERANGQKYLFVNHYRFCYEGEIYIFNLNGGRILEPKKYDGKFAVFNGDIKDTRSFDLFGTQTILGAAVTYENFYIGMDGLPKTNDDYEMYATNASIDDGNKIKKTGETVKLKVDYTLHVGKDVDDQEAWEPVELPAGTKLTMYRTDGKVVYFKLKNGRYTGITVYTDEEEVVQAEQDEGEEIPAVEDILEDIPMLVEEDDLWYLED